MWGSHCPDMECQFYSFLGPLTVVYRLTADIWDQENHCSHIRMDLSTGISQGSCKRCLMSEHIHMWECCMGCTSQRMSKLIAEWLSDTSVRLLTWKGATSVGHGMSRTPALPFWTWGLHVACNCHMHSLDCPSWASVTLPESWTHFSQVCLKACSSQWLK